VGTWTGVVLLVTMSSSGLFSTWQATFGFHQIWETYWFFEHAITSEAGLCSVELISNFQVLQYNFSSPFLYFSYILIYWLFHHHHYHVPDGLGVFLFLDPQNEVGPSISSSVVLCSFVLLVLPFEDFTSSVCCPLDRLPACRRMSLVVGLPPWCL